MQNTCWKFIKEKVNGGYAVVQNPPEKSTAGLDVTALTIALFYVVLGPWRETERFRFCI